MSAASAEVAPAAASRGAAFLFLLLLLTGAVLRLADLSRRPLHGDEAVGAYISEGVARTGSYLYESSNRHGPFQFFLGGLCMRWGGTSFSWIRFPHALLGCLLPLACFGFRRPQTDAGWLLACSLLTFSPMFLFYSRYAIQEIDFAVATALLFSCALAFAQSGSGISLFGFLLAGAWMVTIKETFLIVWGCLAGALVLGFLAGGKRFRDVVTGVAGKLRSGWRAGVLGCLAGGLLVGAAYTDRFRQAAGLGNLLRNLAVMLLQGASTPDALLLHNHPAGFYASLLVRHEWLTVGLSLAGASFAFRTRRPSALLLAFYALLSLGVHCALGYKTPWLLLTPLLPLALLAGEGGAELLARLPRPAAAPRATLVLACALPLLSLPRAVQTSYVRPLDPALGLAYHHAGVEQLQLAGEIRRILAHLPQVTYPEAVIALPYYWPLAWYLRDLTAVAFEPASIPSESPEELATVPVVVTLQSADPKFLAAFIRSGSVPPFHLPGHASRRVVLVPPDYVVARVWIRSDLVPPLPGEH